MPTPLDTSGYVLTTSQFPPPGDGALKLGWSDLDDFTQGYIEALFASEGMCGGFNDASGYAVFRDARFSDLAPETLALILRDCASLLHFVTDYDNTREDGARFWNGGNRLGDPSAFPPLTPTLADDGFVYLREG